MPTIQGPASILNTAGAKLVKNIRSSQTESTPLVEEQAANRGDYHALGDAEGNNPRALFADFHDRPSLSSSFRPFERSTYALKLCGILVAFYLILGVVAFSFVFERWPIVSSCYFSVVTFTTVGYGDLSPNTQLGRLFTIFFTLFGVTILGFFLGIVGSNIVEAETSALEKVKRDSAARVLSLFSKDKSDGEQPEGGGDESETESETKSVWIQLRDIFLLEIPILAIMVLVAIVIGGPGGWSIIDALYFCTITFSTVGFGDMHPDTEGMQLLCIFFLPVAVAVFGELLGQIAGIYMERTEKKFETEFLNREITLTDLTAMDRNIDNAVSRAEFLSFMLVAMQKVDQESIDELDALFNSLDADGSGILDKDDLILLAKKKKEKTENATGTIV